MIGIGATCEVVEWYGLDVEYPTSQDDGCAMGKSSFEMLLVVGVVVGLVKPGTYPIWLSPIMLVAFAFFVDWCRISSVGNVMITPTEESMGTSVPISRSGGPGI